MFNCALISNEQTSSQDSGLSLRLFENRKLPGLAKRVQHSSQMSSYGSSKLAVVNEKDSSEDFSYMLRRFIESKEEPELCENESWDENGCETDSVSTNMHAETGNVSPYFPQCFSLTSFIDSFLFGIGYSSETSIQPENINSVSSFTKFQEKLPLIKTDKNQIKAVKTLNRSPSSVLDLNQFESEEEEDMGIKRLNCRKNEKRHWRYSKVQKNLPLWKRRNFEKPNTLRI